MIFQARKVILACLLSVFLVFSVSIAAYAYSDILAFGDSLSDNGYFQGYPGGTSGNTNPADVYGFRRYSNGPVWVEYLANNLGVSLFDMAYGGATTSIDNPAAFAATGNPIYLTTTGLQWQVTKYGSTFPAISANTLVTVWAGGNDMFNGRPAITAADNIALAIQNLIGMGGMTFLVPNLNISGAYAQWISDFDARLFSDLAATELANPGVDIDYLNLNHLTLTGIDFYDGTFLAQTYGPGVYRWWDTVGVHPTTEVHQQIGAFAYGASVPEPVSIILLLLGIAGLASVRKRMK